MKQSYFYHLVVIVCFVCFLPIYPASSVRSADTQVEIDHLLGFVQTSPCLMNRNGSAHQSDEALAHIKKKYNYFTDEIDTAEKFIELAATKSTISGENYTVDCPGKVRQKTSDWLLEELRKFRGRHANKSVPGKK